MVAIGLGLPADIFKQAGRYGFASISLVMQMPLILRIALIFWLLLLQTWSNTERKTLFWLGSILI